jgi:predicted regulator of Ras-like GTPase activity (Roadblock/LC7/MglB family)
MVVSTDKMMTLIRMVNDSYFLTLTMSPDGNFGKGRYLMRTTAPKLAAEL